VSGYGARMTDAALLALLVAVLSLLVAASSLVWSVSSWRRSGPLLRVHALLYDRDLVIRVFNAGRAPDRIEQVVVGGYRQGRGGIDLTAALGGPVVLEPGGSLSRTVEWREVVPESRQALLIQGWESLWLLRGSMTEQRTEVLSHPGRVPPRSGWELAEAGSNRKRYVPLIMFAPIAALAIDAIPHEGQAWIFICITLAVLLYRIRAGLARTGRISMRRHFEHVTVTVGSTVALFAWVAHLDVTVLVAAYGCAALLLAVPGAISRLIVSAKALVGGIRTRVRTIGPGRGAEREAVAKPRD